jgi:hypothetical protein
MATSPWPATKVDELSEKCRATGGPGIIVQECSVGFLERRHQMPQSATLLFNFAQLGQVTSWRRVHALFAKSAKQAE